MGGFIVADFVKTYPRSTHAAVIMGPVLKDKHRGIDMAKYFKKSTTIIPGRRRILKKSWKRN